MSTIWKGEGSKFLEICRRIQVKNADMRKCVKKQKKVSVFYGWSHIFFFFHFHVSTKRHITKIAYRIICAFDSSKKICNTVIYELSYVSVAEIQVSKKSGYNSFGLL